MKFEKYYGSDFDIQYRGINQADINWIASPKARNDK